MRMNPLRPNTGIAIDGGGIKGLIIARALMTLETELDHQPLISHPHIRILAGTSTGAILTGALAMGMDAGAIADVYQNVGQRVFPPLTPGWFPTPLKHAAEFLLAVLRYSLYSNKELIGVLRETIQKQTGDPDFTLADLDRKLGPGKVLVLTVVDITERRTHFLKSCSPADGQWKLWEAILVSSSAPTALPVWPRAQGERRAYYTDGGVGSYGNPAYVVAQEATTFRGYPPSGVSVLSFGTGWLSAANFERAYQAPTKWRGLDWAVNAPNVITADAIRSQSLDILENPNTRAIDFRRFQFELKEDIPAESYQDDATYAYMKELGEELGKRIADNGYASEDSPRFDPEGLYAHRARYRAARHSAKQT